MRLRREVSIRNRSAPRSRPLRSCEVQPRFWKRELAAVVFDHVAAHVHHDAGVEAVGEPIAQNLTEPDIPAARFPIVLSNPALDDRQLLGYWQVFKVARKPQDLDLPLSNSRMGQERRLTASESVQVDRGYLTTPRLGRG